MKLENAPKITTPKTEYGNQGAIPEKYPDQTLKKPETKPKPNVTEINQISQNPRNQSEPKIPSDRQPDPTR